jgi:antitoxin component YwqK of YwqJK toxin-antitoxin module
MKRIIFILFIFCVNIAISQSDTLHLHYMNPAYFKYWPQPDLVHEEIFTFTPIGYKPFLGKAVITYWDNEFKNRKSITEYAKNLDSKLILSNKEFSIDGILLLESFKSEEGKLDHGTEKQFYSDGTKKHESFDKDSLYYMINYFPNGNKKREIIYGTIISGEQVYKDAALSEKEWCENGQLVFDNPSSIVNLNKRIKVTKYYCNGNVEQEYTLYKDNKVGKQTIYYSNGQKQSELYMSDELYYYGEEIGYTSVQHGVTTFWNENGKITRKETYEMGEQILKEEFE